MLGRQREGTSKLLSLPLVACKTGVEIEETLEFNAVTGGDTGTGCDTGTGWDTGTD